MNRAAIIIISLTMITSLGDVWWLWPHSAEIHRSLSLGFVLTVRKIPVCQSCPICLALYLDAVQSSLWFLHCYSSANLRIVSDIPKHCHIFSQFIFWICKVNPCSNGMTIELSASATMPSINRLNPCSNGMTIELAYSGWSAHWKGS